MTSRPITAWAVKHWNGGLYPSTVRQTRREAIKAFVEFFVPPGETWEDTRKFGVHRAVRVTVSEIVTKGAGHGE